MREDTKPDILVLVEDSMARSFFNAFMQHYFVLQCEDNYLDIRVLEIGGFQNVVNFYVEANNYIFYDDVYLAAFMDKDVETDIIPFNQFGNQEVIRKFNENSSRLHFLPYTPELILVKFYYNSKSTFLGHLKEKYSNQQLQYSTSEDFYFTTYETPFPNVNNQSEYKSYIESRGRFRKRCKNEAERIAKTISEQINQSIEEIFRVSFKYAVEEIDQIEINIRQLLSPVIKRLDH